MHFAAVLAVAAAETEHQGNPMLESLPFGLIAAATFAALGLVVASYRNVANRHADKTESHTEHVETGHGH